ncbi:MAG: phosphoribosylglycinamide formyltransferase [Acutalibacteraceae bacterium]|jgi:phosphoribosylglycinamide formyltransferase-1
MSKAKVAVLVSGGGTNLQALINARKNGIIKSGEITLVISSNPEAYALKRAESAGIKTCVCSKKELGDGFEDALIAAITDNGIDIIVLAGFMCILSEKFTSLFHDRIINVHPSLIPSFCGKGFYGLRVHEAALNYGVKVTGATVHFVNEIPDGGKIIMQKAVEVRDGDTPETLQKRVMEDAEWEILPLALEKVCKEYIKKG